MSRERQPISGVERRYEITRRRVITPEMVEEYKQPGDDWDTAFALAAELDESMFGAKPGEGPMTAYMKEAQERENQDQG